MRMINLIFIVILVMIITIIVVDVINETVIEPAKEFNRLLDEAFNNAIRFP